MMNIFGDRSLPKRMFRAAKLEVDLYEEVEADTGANGQAFASVVIASLASGLGAGIAGGLSEGGACAEAGRAFITWASEDLKTYAKHSYDPKTHLRPSRL